MATWRTTAANRSVRGRCTNDSNSGGEVEGRAGEPNVNVPPAVSMLLRLTSHLLALVLHDVGLDAGLRLALTSKVPHELVLKERYR